MAQMIRDQLSGYAVTLTPAMRGGQMSVGNSCLVPIKLELRLRGIIYRDQFEWVSSGLAFAVVCLCSVEADVGTHAYLLVCIRFLRTSTSR